LIRKIVDDGNVGSISFFGVSAVGVEAVVSDIFTLLTGLNEK